MRQYKLHLNLYFMNGTKNVFKDVTKTTWNDQQKVVEVYSKLDGEDAEMGSYNPLNTFVVIREYEEVDNRGTDSSK